MRVKKILAIFISAACIAASCLSAYAERLSFPSVEGKNSTSARTEEELFASVLPISSDGSLEAFSGIGFAPFIPVQFDQFVISLIDTKKSDSIFKFDEEPLISRFQVNSGIRMGSYLSDPQSLLLDELLGEDSKSFEIKSSVIFVGLGLDVNAFSIKGKAFVGNPMETLSNKLHGAKGAENENKQGFDADVHGFEASAGYQLSNMIALGAGFGKMTDNNRETDQSEDVYAVYAQAILAIAPGFQVKPEVGKVDRVKEENNSEEIDQSFYAGAIWEINF
jgi:hypothetical protein